MNWQETVMNLKQYNDFTFRLYADRKWHNWCEADQLDTEFQSVLEHQAKLTWDKAEREGMRKALVEVENFWDFALRNYECNVGTRPHLDCRWCNWQAFLKQGMEKQCQDILEGK